MKMNSIYGITKLDLEEYFISINQKNLGLLKYMNGFIERKLILFDEMSNLGKDVIDM